MDNRNTPYVKQVDSNGKVLNEITKNNPYLHFNKSRAEKSRENKGRHRGNNKGVALTVIGKWKYFKTLQTIFNKDTGEVIKTIEHTLTK